MIIICILISTSVWIMSFLLSVVVMVRKDITPNFWSILFILLPIVNTWIIIKYYRIDIDIDGFKIFWQQLKSE